MRLPHCPYDLEPTPIGAGGYAVVYRGVHQAAQTTAAVKTLAGRGSREDVARAKRRLKREIEVQRKFSHRNIMPIGEVAPDASWYAMPLAVATLQGRRPGGGPPLLNVVKQVSLGLAHAHASGYVHRDLTPSNVLRLGVIGEERWVIADWGLVRRATAPLQSPLTEHGAVVGTNGFRAPESFGGGALDQRADFYALGRIVGWSLTGRTPVGFDSLPVTDAQWTAFVERMTQFRAEDRPSSAHEVLNMLREIESTLPVVEQGSDACSRCGSSSGPGTRCLRCGSYLVEYN